MAARQKKGYKTAPAQSDHDSIFDRAIALLLQLEVGDAEGFKILSHELETAAASKGLPSKIAGLILSAKERIDSAIQGGKHEAEEALTETSRLLQAASDIREDELQKLWQPECVPATAAADIQSDEIIAEALFDEADPASAAISKEQNSFAEMLSADVDRELLTEFIAESRELLETSEAALLVLESNPEDSESINTVFRAFHTVKGTSGFLGLQMASDLAHLAESLLSRIRKKEIRLIGGYADLALRSLDMLKKTIMALECASNGAPLKKPDGYEDLKTILYNPEIAGVSENDSDESLAACKPTQEQSEIASDGGNALEHQAVGAKDNSRQQIQEFKSSIRVNTARLDRLIDMVGELVIAQSMVSQDRNLLEANCHELLRKVTHIGKIVRELQDLSMSLRMVPLRGTFQKMQRVVRDLARKSGKSVELLIDDAETEIDRHMVDVLNDVLVHMVRNAIDHGIELPDERAKCGKCRIGAVWLTAYQSGGSVVVEIKDNGRGLIREKILQKAIEAGLVDPGKTPGDNEIYNLIFAPGLSTSEKLTDVSGRGVGMDVVRKGVEALRGRIDIHSEPGAGSTFTVRLPLTLAITDGMLVRVGAERYIIPTISIHLCFRPDRECLSTVSGRGELVLLRGELMPIFRLHRLFNINSAIEDPSKGLLVVVGDEERRCALLVDELLGQQQVVAKSLANAVGAIAGVSGGAILGDGQVGLILDPGEVIAQARQTPDLCSCPDGAAA
jgi:two-component system, chemotaxis family, sensor kinase CheA